MSKENNKVLICTERGCKGLQQEDGSECQLHYDKEKLSVEFSSYYGSISVHIKKGNISVGKIPIWYVRQYLENKIKKGNFKVVEIGKGNAYDSIELK